MVITRLRGICRLHSNISPFFCTLDFENTPCIRKRKRRCRSRPNRI